jgi:hypothetical protein
MTKIIYYHKFIKLYKVNQQLYYLGTKTFIRDNRNFDSSEFDSTGVKLYIFIHNEVRDFDKNSTQPEIRVYCYYCTQ